MNLPRLGRFKVGMVVVLLAVPATYAYGASTDSETTGDPRLQSFLDRPFVSMASDGDIVVDFAKDPQAASDAIERAGDALDGQVIDARGLAVKPPAERRAEDQRLEGDTPPIKEQLCPNLPEFDRGIGTRPYLGCDPATGVQSILPAVRGTTALSVSTAMSAVVAPPGTPGPQSRLPQSS